MPPSIPHAALEPLFLLRVLSPSIVLLSTLSLLFKRPSVPTQPQAPSPITSVVVATRTHRRALIYAFLSLTSLTFLLDGFAFVVYAVVNKDWPAFTGLEVNAVAGVLAFAGLAALGAWKEVKGVDVWSLNRLKIGIFGALALDIAQVVLLALAIPRPLSTVYLLHLAFPSFRVLLLVPLLFALVFPRIAYVPVEAQDEETPTDTSLLLPAQDAAAPSAGLSLSPEASKYGTFRSGRTIAPASGVTTRTNTPSPSTVRLPPTKAQEAKEDIALDPSWGEIFVRIRRIAPYLWPSKSFGLQLLALFCLLIMIVGRVVNFLVPLVFSQLVRIFEEGTKVSPWPYLGAYVVLRFLQSTGGLAALRDTLWIPVMQYSDREMSQLSFDHLLQLSFAFHTRRKTGEILRILDRGAAINRTFETLVFNVLPTFADIAVALVFFVIYFEWTLALVIFAVMAAYVTASVVLTRWRTKLRRAMNDRDVAIRGIHTDCLLNYETVKYFNGEQHEGERYREAIRQYQSLEYKVMVSLNLLNLIQNFIISLGLLVGSMIVALRVVRGQSQPHEFVFFITYLAQLYGPLNMLGYLYRTINQSLVDTERLLKLLNEPRDINDKPNAPDLIIQDGSLEFENVSFSYDKRTTALDGVSFKVPKGSSVALVGESGAGKSTILRLLYRFYDLQEGEGRILIDGQDIRDVTQASLRKAIGVVPQDPVLFNASIGYNIGYGKFGATQEEIVAAAKAAQIHDRILSFPDGYDTKVGERGIRLSGGEKQRVAIARTLLKDPPILLLDEATSALDTSTEKDIQKALQNLVQGRSSLSIAHRLSTIATADVILVLKDGRIVEQGTHAELLALGGVFAAMWADQVSSNDDVSAHRKSAVVSGFDVDGAPQEPLTEAIEAVPQVGTEEVAQDKLADNEGSAAPEETVAGTQDAPAVAFPVSDDKEVSVEPVVTSAEQAPEAPASAPVAFPNSEESAPVAFPSADDAAPPVAFPSSDSPAPLAFPTSPETGSQREGSVAERAPGVTFQAAQTPERSGTPDPEADGKRRRTLSTQGIQRLARRISITTRRQGSGSNIPSIPTIAGSILPSLKRQDTARSSTDEGSVKDATASNESPRASVASDVGKPKGSKIRKEKKDKRKSTS
ncbi:hypothetical protein DICSQDRAFT_110500 [Dichomitus squalens LYAD-421 SS1]|uniref:P-loop containing nucleoside triphosphate hydrolase protein n=1 Tax=Dichomitus squalens (strain LYAD-421) TaxID=732165 RepID=R7SR44_DICSQ|nr:uncharacterized protein DICSQDRAFT_110500 [Dichomitus squalens LYAD-421 SS1]EJF58200.1 hypothetical protein DICSQDRAFT_110500 [Dichomitus squalens LYAD-421 SS1]